MAQFSRCVLANLNFCDYVMVAICLVVNSHVLLSWEERIFVAVFASADCIECFAIEMPSVGAIQVLRNAIFAEHLNGPCVAKLAEDFRWARLKDVNDFVKYCESSVCTSDIYSGLFTWRSTLRKTMQKPNSLIVHINSCAMALDACFGYWNRNYIIY